MSTERVLVIIAVCIVGTAFCAWQVRRALREPLERDRLAADARHYAAPLFGTGPDPDAEPGHDVVLQDECELIWSVPVIDPAGLERLRTAVRDEQEKGGESA